MTKIETHALERTSPKGTAFLGTCTKCGATNLPLNAATEACSNPANLTQDEAVMLAIKGHSTNHPKSPVEQFEDMWNAAYPVAPPTSQSDDSLQSRVLTYDMILPSQSDEALVGAVNEYNSVLRSCAQVAKRKGENTNWDNLSKRITHILEKHHATWLKHWDGKIS